MRFTLFALDAFLLLCRVPSLSSRSCVAPFWYKCVEPNHLYLYNRAMNIRPQLLTGVFPLLLHGSNVDKNVQLMLFLSSCGCRSFLLRFITWRCLHGFVATLECLLARHIPRSNQYLRIIIRTWMREKRAVYVDHSRIEEVRQSSFSLLAFA